MFIPKKDEFGADRNNQVTREYNDATIFGASGKEVNHVQGSLTVTKGTETVEINPVVQYLNRKRTWFTKESKLALICELLGIATLESRMPSKDAAGKDISYTDKEKAKAEAELKEEIAFALNKGFSTPGMIEIVDWEDNTNKYVLDLFQDNEGKIYRAQSSDIGNIIAIVAGEAKTLNELKWKWSRSSTNDKLHGFGFKMLDVVRVMQVSLVESVDPADAAKKVITGYLPKHTPVGKLNNGTFVPNAAPMFEVIPVDSVGKLISRKDRSANDLHYVVIPEGFAPKASAAQDDMVNSTHTKGTGRNSEARKRNIAKDGKFEYGINANGALLIKEEFNTVGQAEQTLIAHGLKEQL